MDDDGAPEDMAANVSDLCLVRLPFQTNLEAGAWKAPLQDSSMKTRGSVKGRHYRSRKEDSQAWPGYTGVEAASSMTAAGTSSATVPLEELKLERR